MVDPGGISDESQDGLLPGTRLGKYEIVRLLGAGGMGAVYEAAHTEIGKRVAIKVLSLAIAAVPGARARFLREAQLTSRVRHPNIVDVTDMGSDAGQTYLVMEFLRGEDLAQRLGRTGPLPPQALADIMVPVCAAVIEAHKAGITHRDLKPQNIFLAVGPHGTQPKVLDFGISKGNDLVGSAGGLTGTGAMIGTPFYLAPEQIMDTRAAGPNSDQYALGVIMYECLTGQRPFEAENLFVVFQAIVSGNPVPPSQRRPGIPAALEAIVMRAMHLSPTARFPSIGVLGRALLAFASARTRSIWEEAFQESGDLGSAEEPPRGDSATLLAAATPATPPLTAPRALTPAGVTPPPSKSGRVATPIARVHGAVGAPTPLTQPGNIKGSAMPFAGAPDLWTMDLAAGESVPDMRPERSRTGKVVAIFAVVVVGGLVAGLALQRSRAQHTEAGLTEAPLAKSFQKSSEKAGQSPPSSTALTDRPAGPGAPSGTTPEKVASGGTGTKAEQAGSGSVPIGAEAPRTYRLSVRTEPERAAIALDGKVVGTGHLESTLPLDQTRHQLRVTAEGFETRTMEFTDEAPPPLIELRRTRGASENEPSALKRRTIARPARRGRPESPQPQQTAPNPPAPQRNLNPNGAPVID